MQCISLLGNALKMKCNAAQKSRVLSSKATRALQKQAVTYYAHQGEASIAKDGAVRVISVHESGEIADLDDPAVALPTATLLMMRPPVEG